MHNSGCVPYCALSLHWLLHFQCPCSNLNLSSSFYIHCFLKFYFFNCIIYHFHEHWRYNSGATSKVKTRWDLCAQGSVHHTTSQLPWCIMSWPLNLPVIYAPGYPLISISSVVNPYHFTEGILHSYLTQSTCLRFPFTISSVHCHQIIMLKQHIHSKVTDSGKEKNDSILSLLYDPP